MRFDTEKNRYEDWKFWILCTRSKLIGYENSILCDVEINKQEKKDYIIGMLQGKSAIYSELINNKKFKQYKFVLLFLKLKTQIHSFYHIINKKINR